MHDLASSGSSVNRRARWSGERVAGLGFLLGVGWDAKRIADDPLIATTANNVHRQAQRFGLAFRHAARPFNLPSDALTAFDAGALKRGLTRESLMKSLLLTIAGEPALIDSILDDGDGL